MRDLTFDIKGRDRTQGAFDSARRNARGFNRDLDRTGAGLKLAAGAAKAFAAAFTVTAVANFGRVVRETVGEASALAKMADKVGVTTDEIQKMTFGFGQAGVAASDIERNLEQWSKRVSEANSYGGRLADIFKANNVSLTDQNGKLRGSTELMRELANLIQNAATDQERMTIATEAFGRSGGDMVLALRNGAAGMDQLMRRTEAAGGVIDEQLLRKAEKIDDEFDRIARTIEVNVKTAILQAVVATDQFYKSVDAAAGRWEKLTSLPAPDWLTTLLTVPGAALFPGQIVGGAIRRQLEGGGEESGGKGGRVGGQSMDQAQAGFNEAFEAWRQRQTKPTIIPKTPERNGGAKAAREQVSAYEKVMQALQNEADAIRLNATEHKILTAQRQAEVSASSSEGQVIAARITGIETERLAMKRLEEQHQAVRNAAEYGGGMLLDTLFSIVDGAESAEDAFKRLGLQILEALAYGALLGQGPLGGLFGGGLLGGLFKGFRAEGGPVDPWGTYVVGEKGPEILRMGGRGGQVTSNAASFGGSPGRAASGPIPLHVMISVDDEGKIKAMIDQARQSAVQGGAALAVSQVTNHLGAIQSQNAVSY